MINLLPPDDKRQISAGKANILLVRYCTMSLLLAVPLFLLLGGTYFIMNNAKDIANANIAESNTRTSKYQHIQVEADRFAKNLEIAQTILGKEIKYSRIAVTIAQALPAGITLSSLSLSEESFGNPIIINATGNSYQAALQLKTALEESDFFKDAHLQEVSLDGEGDDQTVSIAISVVIAPEIVNS